MRKLNILFMLLPLVLVLSTQLVLGQVPKTMNFQGLLKDATGQPLADGSYSIKFTIYDAAFGGAVIWSEIQNVSVQGGLVNTIMGKTQPLTAQFDIPYWLGVKIQADPEMSPRFELASAPYAFRSVFDQTGSGGGNVPVGTVIDWWRPNNTFAIPAGFQICDGSTVTDGQSPFQGLRLPDLRNKFVRGASTPSDVGKGGGSASHKHSVDPPSVRASSDGLHDHNVDPSRAFVSLVSGHTHQVDPPTAGTQTGRTTTSHKHPWATFQNDRFTSWDQSENTVLIGNEAGASGGNFLPLSKRRSSSPLTLYTRTGGSTHFHRDLEIPEFPSKPNASHNHSLDLPAKKSTSNGSHRHDVNISAFDSDSKDHTPKYVGLLKLMRIK